MIRTSVSNYLKGEDQTLLSSSNNDQTGDTSLSPGNSNKDQTQDTTASVNPNYHTIQQNFHQQHEYQQPIKNPDGFGNYLEGGQTDYIDDEYHNNSYYDPDMPLDFYPNINQNSSSSNNKSIITRLFTCFGHEHLQRSFCFGAIDGLLTGSSITFAATGLGILSPTSSLQQKITFILLTFAACAADGLCMAIGHVWSTFVLNDNFASEMFTEKKKFDDSRGESKAALIDMLLMRGMLKIDAMTIVDTLEGYPDLFISAILGESHGSGVLGAIGAGAITAGLDTHDHHVIPPSPMMYGNNHHYHTVTPQNHHSPMDHDDDDYHDHEGDKESRQEAILMMLAFSIFSVIPPLIYAYLPGYFNPEYSTSTTKSNNSHSTSTFNYYSHASTNSYYDYNPVASTNATDSGVSATSVTVTALSIIMFLLGIWKSKFFDSSVIVFGIETVLVLVLCNIAAYYFGYWLNSVFLES